MINKILNVIMKRIIIIAVENYTVKADMNINISSIVGSNMDEHKLILMYF